MHFYSLYVLVKWVFSKAQSWSVIVDCSSIDIFSVEHRYSDTVV